MRKNADATPIGRLVANLVARRGLGGMLPLAAVRDGLARVIGPDLACRVRVAGLRGSVVTLEADSAALAYELKSFASKRILEELKKQPGAEFVAGLRFRSGASTDVR